MEKNKLISVIIPCHNYGHFLTESLNSVLNQTYENWEVLIIDYGSTDNTKSISNKFVINDKRFQYFEQDNQGRSSARNFGLSKSKGSFIQFLDADDLLKPEKFEKQILQFKKDDSIDVSYTNFDFFNSETGEIFFTKHFSKQVNNPLNEFLFEFGITGFIIPLHSALFRKDIFSNDITFPVNIEAREDWVLWVKLAIKNKKFKYLDEKLILYRKHSKSTTENQKIINYNLFISVFTIFEMIPNEVKDAFILFYSDWFTKKIEDEKNKLQQFYSSSAYKIIKNIRRWFSSCRILFKNEDIKKNSKS